MHTLSASSHTFCTLAIAPGTREMGYAVLEAKELLYFGVHTFRQRTAARHLLADGQRCITRLLTTFDPQLFVIAQTRYTKSKRAPLLHVFVEEMQRFATRHHLHVAAYTPTTVKHTITGHRNATKRAVAETIVQWYPYLAKYLHTDLRTQEQYWEHMFDAVALGLTGFEDIDTKGWDHTQSPQYRA